MFVSQSAYIKFVEGSAVSSMSLAEVKEHLQAYREQLAQTGKQLDWDYADFAFPYTIESKPEGEGRWFYLKGKRPPYKFIGFAVGSDTEAEQERHFIQVTLADDSTFADKSKGNELCKHLGRLLKAEVHLFNGRIMQYNLQ